MFIKNIRKLLALFLFMILVIPSIPILAEEEAENKKVIYLTFDDGPGGKVTTETLDILKDEGVPGTFFLIGNQINGQEDLLIRMKDEGHALGLHSMSHDRNKLYSSPNSFLKEMLDTKKVILDVTEVNINILRFPFGCNNNSYHLKNNLVDLLHENGLKIYDWNVDSTDGAQPNISPSTYIKKSQSDKEEIILLMHCGFQNKTSPKALREIIKYYKLKGYTFKKIDDDTPEVFHFIK